MTDERDEAPQDELSPGERRAFEALPREADLPPELEERTVAMLRRAGHLPTPITVSRRSGGQTGRTWWIAGAIAATLAVFASGIAIGQYLGMRNATVLAFVSAHNATEAADRVQRTGDRYVQALASLSNLPATTDIVARNKARETAMAVLGAAAEEIAHLAPDDPLAAAVMRGLNERSRRQGPEAPSSRSVIWY
ncbi:MAG TPA: hypothetical protein VGI92_11250 [Gemmatimonadales bacterium]